MDFMETPVLLPGVMPGCQLCFVTGGFRIRCLCHTPDPVRATWDESCLCILPSAGCAENFSGSCRRLFPEIVSLVFVAGG